MMFELSNGHNVELISEGNQEKVLFDGKEVAKKLIPSGALIKTPSRTSFASVSGPQNQKTG